MFFCFFLARFTHGFMMEMLQLKMLKSQTNLLKTSIQKLKDRLETQKRHEQFKVGFSSFLFLAFDCASWLVASPACAWGAEGVLVVAGGHFFCEAFLSARDASRGP